MSKTAIVPVEPDSDMILRTDSLSMTQMTKAELVYGEMLNARPAVPDELIEEAAKAILARRNPAYDIEYLLRTNRLGQEWNEAIEDARAAARVFNGGN